MMYTYKIVFLYFEKTITSGCDCTWKLDFLKVVRMVFWSGVVGFRSIALRARTIALPRQKLDFEQVYVKVKVNFKQ